MISPPNAEATTVLPAVPEELEARPPEPVFDVQTVSLLSGETRTLWYDLPPCKFYLYEAARAPGLAARVWPGPSIPPSAIPVYGDGQTMIPVRSQHLTISAVRATTLTVVGMRGVEFDLSGSSEPFAILHHAVYTAIGAATPWFTPSEHFASWHRYRALRLTMRVTNTGGSTYNLETIAADPANQAFGSTFAFASALGEGAADSIFLNNNEARYANFRWRVVRATGTADTATVNLWIVGIGVW